MGAADRPDTVGLPRDEDPNVGPLSSTAGTLVQLAVTPAEPRVAAMTQESTTIASPADAPSGPVVVGTEAIVARRCPWCSEVLPASETVRCPHCYANLVPDGEPHVPGLTEVEAPTAAKVRRAEPPKRSKLLSWISGEVSDEPTPPATDIAAEALAPPPRDVRREMLRLQLEAEGVTVSEDGSIEPPAAAKADAAPIVTPVAEISMPETAATDAAEDQELIRRAS
jgi:hypothetical protein